MKKLEVNNLKISFRTGNGKVQAVRDISFDLEEGETLCIVGESGSGKSVSVRAILGILANNAIVEGGEIFYDGKDLLKIDEEDFHKIRGDKIAMIFQDPLSSLNPVVRIGKQLTEAMILKNKVNRKNCRHDFNSKINALLHCTNQSDAYRGNSQKAEYNKKLVEKFKKFEVAHAKMESEYNVALDSAREAYENIKDLLISIPKKAIDKKEVARQLVYIMRFIRHSENEFVVKDMKRLNELCDEIKSKKGEQNTDVLIEPLTQISEILKAAVDATRPDFFALGYYVTFESEGAIPAYKTVDELNNITTQALSQKFLQEFVSVFQNGIGYSFKNSIETKKVVLRKLGPLQEKFVAASTKGEKKKIAAEMIREVESSIDRLEIEKDSRTYTFRTSILSAIDRYYFSIKKNVKEQKRYERQSARRDRLTAKGRTLDWVVVDPDIADLDELMENMNRVVEQIKEHLATQIEHASEINSTEKMITLIDFLKDKCSGMVYRVSKIAAKNKAIKLMEEVGIPNPRKRYRQYPFEFSGGMRQRIVIAIALSANPDILICDEPTTALDVTIQSQILELINKLKVERNLSIIFITHDLGVVANMADRIAVMYAGKIVETGTSEDVFYDPRHPYTWALLSSMPDLDTDEKLESIPGTPPNMIYPPKGDAFAERNRYALKIDFEEQPPMFKISDTHYAATWLLHPNAPKIDPPKIVTERIARSKQKEGEKANG